MLPMVPIRRRSRDEVALRRSGDDSDAFREFYDAYAGRVVVFFARRTFDSELAADLAGETFAVAFERRRQFRGTSVEAEQGWLFAIARNLLSAHWKRGDVERRALIKLGLDPPNLSLMDIERIDELAGLSALRPHIAEALAALPIDQATAVRGRVLDELSYAELAEQSGVTEQVARARVSRGLRAVGQRIDGLVEDSL